VLISTILLANRLGMAGGGDKKEGDEATPAAEDPEVCSFASN
jgi:hypothetical protein